MTPYPTPTRLALADAIQRGVVKRYHWHQPISRWEEIPGMYRKVTAGVAELVAADRATIPPGPPDGYSVVELTDAGRAWLANAEGVT